MKKFNLQVVVIVILVFIVIGLLAKLYIPSIKGMGKKVVATQQVTKKHHVVVKHEEVTIEKKVVQVVEVVAVNTPVPAPAHEGNTAYIKNMFSDDVEMFITNNSKVTGAVIFKVGAPVPPGVTHEFNFSNKDRQMHVVVFVRLSSGIVHGYPCVFDENTREVAFEAKEKI